MAGLAAANRLADLGAPPLVIEGGDYPMPKVCGEFLSPECLPILKEWGIDPLREVKEALFHTPKGEISIQFPIPAACMQQMQREQALLDYAISKGVAVRTQTKVIDFKWENNRHVLSLSTGEEIFAKQLLVATGRLTKTIPKFPYIGFKTYLEKESEHMEMYVSKKGYLGMAPVGEKKTNLVCLAKKEHFTGDCETFLRDFPIALNGTEEWLTCQVPEFGIKKVPKWPNAFFLGDAAGTIPPITGGGVAMGLLSGRLAAEYVLRGDAAGYRRAWKKAFSSPIRWGMLLHRFMLNPLLLKGLNSFSGLSDLIFNLTRSRSVK